jgi:hypothetical protein
MSNAASPSTAHPVPARNTAFVVHLTVAADASAGRVEHVATGRTARFESAEELLRFMRDTLAAIANDGL